MKPYIRPAEANRKTVSDLVPERAQNGMPQRTQPHGVVDALAVLQLRMDLDVVVQRGRILQRKRLELALQRIQHLPHDQNDQIDDQQTGDHCVQLPRFDLFLRLAGEIHVGDGLTDTKIHSHMYLRVLLLLGGEPMYAPHFAEHGTVGERKSGGQEPRPRLADL